MAEQNKPKRSTQGPLTIWHGMNLSSMVRFLRMNPALHVSQAGRIVSLPFFAAYNSAMGGVESLIHGRKIQSAEIKQPPIFILGFWRSGTTLLHNLMTSDPRYTFPTLYQTVFPWHFLTTYRVNSALTSWMVPATRPMDNVRVSWDAPQEDEVALCIMSLVSSYTLLAKPADLQGAARSHDLDSLPDQDRKRWERSLIHLMKKITVKNPKPIILKSPSHTYRIKQLVQMFPNAKFVYIHRNPYDVIRSAIHLRKTMIEENCFGKPVFPQIEEDVTKLFVEAFDSYQAFKPLIPSGHLSEVRYESLADDPIAEMERIYGELTLGEFDVVREIIEPQVPEIKGYKKNRFEFDVPLLGQVVSRCEPFYRHFGYEIPEAAASMQSFPSESDGTPSTDSATAPSL